MKSGHITNSILSIVFLMILFSVMALFLFTKKEEMNKVENRMLAKMPEFDVSKLDPFPGEYDKYYSDHFPFRSTLVQIFNKVNYNNFRVSPLPDKVVIGLNDFLFMSGKQMETYRGENLFTQSELEAILKELQYRDEFCANEGAKFYFVIIPQKTTIYEEYIPTRYKTTRKKTIRTQLEDFLNEYQFPYIDPTSNLKSKKSDTNFLYLKTDNHWNNLGAFYASKFIIDEIKKDYPETSSIDLSEFQISEEGRNGGNLAQMLNMSNELLDVDFKYEYIGDNTAVSGRKHPYAPPEGFAYPWEYEEVFLNPCANDLKALIIRESFGTKQRQFYREAFGETVMIFDAWHHELNKDIIRSEKPDIVIIQILESMLPNLLLYPSKKETTSSK